MTLDAYLAEQKLTETAFAALVGVDQSTINRARKGQVPSPRVLAEITAQSNGAVTPNDFFGFRSSEQSSVAA